MFLDGEENVKLGDFGLATSKKVRTKVVADVLQKVGMGVGVGVVEGEGMKDKWSREAKEWKEKNGWERMDGK